MRIVSVSVAAHSLKAFTPLPTVAAVTCVAMALFQGVSSGEPRLPLAAAVIALFWVQLDGPFYERRTFLVWHVSALAVIIGTYAMASNYWLLHIRWDLLDLVVAAMILSLLYDLVRAFRAYYALMAVELPPGGIRLSDMYRKNRHQNFTNQKKRLVQPLSLAYALHLSYGGIALGVFFVAWPTFRWLYSTLTGAQDYFADSWIPRAFIMAPTVLFSFGVFLSVVLGAMLLLQRRSSRRLLQAASHRLQSVSGSSLYLRPFEVDARQQQLWKSRFAPKVLFEEAIVSNIRDIGIEVYAVGIPGERLPPLGAVRQYVKNVVSLQGESDWKEVVQSYIKDAQVIFAVHGNSDGYKWELSEIKRQDRIDSLAIVFLPETSLTTSDWQTLELIGVPMAPQRNTEWPLVCVRGHQHDFLMITGSTCSSEAYEVAIEYALTQTRQR